MKKIRRIFISMMGLCVIAFVLNCIYIHFYKIDTSNLHWAFLARIEDSPDHKSSIGVRLLRESENSDVTFIQGIVGEKEEDSHNYTHNSRIIFWQRVDSGSIGQKKTENGILENWVEVKWIDSKNIQINGIDFKVDEGYDYRRSKIHD